MYRKSYEFCNFCKDFRSSSFGWRIKRWRHWWASATIAKILIASDKALPYKFNEFRWIHDSICLCNLVVALSKFTSEKKIENSSSVQKSCIFSWHKINAVFIIAVDNFCRKRMNKLLFNWFLNAFLILNFKIKLIYWRILLIRMFHSENDF